MDILASFKYRGYQGATSELWVHMDVNTAQSSRVHQASLKNNQCMLPVHRCASCCRPQHAGIPLAVHLNITHPAGVSSCKSLITLKHL
jgi:hypothetical protein